MLRPNKELWEGTPSAWGSKLLRSRERTDSSRHCAEHVWDSLHLKVLSCFICKKERTLHFPSLFPRSSFSVRKTTRKFFDIMLQTFTKNAALINDILWSDNAKFLIKRTVNVKTTSSGDTIMHNEYIACRQLPTGRNSLVRNNFCRLCWSCLFQNKVTKASY